jgi:hypothetical protein
MRVGPAEGKTAEPLEAGRVGDRVATARAAMLEMALGTAMTAGPVELERVSDRARAVLELGLAEATVASFEVERVPDRDEGRNTMS